jgi:hypothetical protein
MKIIAVYSENHTKPTNIICCKNTELFLKLGFKGSNSMCMAFQACMQEF